VICKIPDPEIEISQPWNLVDYCPGVRQQNFNHGKRLGLLYIPGPEIEIPRLYKSATLKYEVLIFSSLLYYQHWFDGS